MNFALSTLVFGGSFDPPHNAHVRLPELVRQKLGFDTVLYVPAARAPHKLGQVQTPAVHRLAMLELALSGCDHARILTDELDRAADGKPSYTVDTLEALIRTNELQAGPEPRGTSDEGPDQMAKVDPGALPGVMRLLIGGDQLRIFDQWHASERIEQLAEPVVMVRPPDTPGSLLAALPNDAARNRWRPRLIDVPAMDVSSTDIRRRVAQGEPIDDRVPPAVAAYIREHGLYR